MKNVSLNSPRSGFSLFEMLVTIAVMGVLSSIAISAFGSQRDVFEDTRDRRNAQEVAQVCMTANAAGLSFVAVGSVEDTIKNAVLGGAPSSGSFKGRLFKAGEMSAEDITGAARFLEIKNGELAYRYDP